MSSEFARGEPIVGGTVTSSRGATFLTISAVSSWNPYVTIDAAGRVSLELAAERVRAMAGERAVWLPRCAARS